MSSSNPRSKSKEDYKEIIDQISSVESAVGIDAQYTHAIIIEYLEEINKRLENIERSIKNPQ